MLVYLIDMPKCIGRRLPLSYPYLPASLAAEWLVTIFVQLGSLSP